MSKRVRTSRIANSKKSRRPRPSGEREIVGRESVSSVDFEDRHSAPVSEAPPSSEAESQRTSAVDSDRPSAEPSATPGPVTASVEPIVPATVTGETPPPPAVSAEEVVPGDTTPAPPPAVAQSTPAEPAVAQSTVAEPASAKSAATRDEAPSGAGAGESKAESKPEVGDAPGAKAQSPTGKKKKKKGASSASARPEDVNAASGGFSLNEPLARGFYESAPPPDLHDEDELEEAAQPVALSPEILERKAKLRRIVVGVFAAASLVVILVAGKTLIAKNPPNAADVTHAMDSAPAPTDEAPKPAEPAKAEPPAPAPAPAPEASAKADEKADEKADAKADEKADDKDKKDEAKPEDKPKGDPAELKKVASKLYNSGRLKDAIPALREAIAADPDDALPYLFLGDALTNVGKWPDAKEAYSDCVTYATKGPKHECAAMGGTKKKK